jgi:excisionase family DNA binding protein
MSKKSFLEKSKDNPAVNFISKPKEVKVVETPPETVDSEIKVEPIKEAPEKPKQEKPKHIGRAKDLADLKLYTLTDLEDVLGVSHRTLQTYIKEGKLKGIKLGGKWRISKTTLEEFINGGKSN